MPETPPAEGPCRRGFIFLGRRKRETRRDKIKKDSVQGENAILPTIAIVTSRKRKSDGSNNWFLKPIRCWIQKAGDKLPLFVLLLQIHPTKSGVRYLRCRADHQHNFRRNRPKTRTSTSVPAARKKSVDLDRIINSALYRNRYCQPALRIPVELGFDRPAFGIEKF